VYSLGTCVLKSPEESLLYSPIVYFPLIVCGILLLLFFVLLAMAYQKARSEIGMEEYVRDVSRCWNARTLLSLSLSLSHTHTHTRTTGPVEDKFESMVVHTQSSISFERV